jgi:sulfate-transporting ATPase
VASIGPRFADWLAERRRLDERPPAVAVDDTPSRPSSARPSAAHPPGGPSPLRVEQLSVTYGGVAAVIDVSLEVGSGTIAGLIGPNGAGKTSVIDAIVGFAPSRGKVWLSGVDLEGMAPHARVRAGLSRTFQSLELYDDLTVEENLSVAVLGTDRHLRHHAVDRALRRVGIEPLRLRPAGELSQGERQLVSIARACVADPQVLLLDEPAAGLNPTETALLGERIRAISEAGTAVLLVDHDVRFVLDLCRPIFVMDVGRVIAEGGPEEIRSNQEVAAAYLGTTHGSAAAAQ